MPKLARFALTVATLLGSWGCASGGAGFSPAPDPSREQALVYAYRPESSIEALVSYALAADGVPLAALSNGSYTTYYTEAPRATFTIDSMASARQLLLPIIGIAYYVRYATDDAEQLADLELEPGQTYYLRFSLDGGWRGVVDPDTARSELRGLAAARRLD
jgi:hypothetical protein